MYKINPEAASRKNVTFQCNKTVLIPEYRMHPKSHLCELTTTQMTKRLTFFGKDELMFTNKVAEKSAGQIWMFDTEKEV